ncbi:MarR family winged helix-turn-helix transcriptional regulator [Knoellia koreensis]|jgi:DNA-binding MarR family transcriptional regulator|uniref:MarR family transcriptional regulator n=1 Tax=Knoellia koreensis TaxID=2730921 RepID=A0A849HJX0_9MICO|nr:MarR family transcriptional regulator [Knoellia sp. DB2414S]NNM47592.1 MarR family transcriptional regulator [Knoellia sp. DB2414S]
MGTSSAGEPRWLTTDEQRAWRAYLRGSRLIEEALDKDLQSHGVQLTEYEIISMLSETPRQRLRMSTLADLVVQSRSRLTHTATRLENRGWVRREACLEDKRGVELVLTDQGQAAVEEMARVHVESVRRAVLDPVPPELFLELGRAMEAIRLALAPDLPHPAVMAEAEDQGPIAAEA